MYGTTAELSMNPAEKEGQAKGFQGPPGMGGVPDLNLSLTLMALTPLKTSGQLFCQYPSLQADVPSRLGQAPLTGMSQK